MSGINILLDSARGIYIPRDFARCFDPNDWNIDENSEDWKIIESGPDTEWYFDAWQSIEINAFHIDKDGNKWTLYQDGDLFAICTELMTPEEYENFFGTEI